MVTGYIQHSSSRLLYRLVQAGSSKVSECEAALTRTCSQQTDGVGRLGQEVGVTEHVLLVDHEAQEGVGGVVDVKHKLLLQPYWIQTVISCQRDYVSNSEDTE